MRDAYDPARYWQDRLSRHFDLKGVGYIGFSRRYNWWLYRRRADVFDAAVGRRDLEGRAVLDVGCGTGFFVKRFLGLGADVDGVDITDVSVNRLAAQQPARFWTLDIATAGVVWPRTYDLVNMWDVMLHIVDTDGFTRALANVAAACAPGAMFLVTDHFGAPEDTHPAPHVRHRSLASYEASMSQLGFTLIELRPIFHLLNRRVTFTALDNYLAPIYYARDRFLPCSDVSNTALAVWRYGQGATSETVLLPG